MKGKIVHIEIPAEDTQRAMKFWGEVAGWKFQNYADQTEGEKGILVYFEADDIDAELGRIRDAGGQTQEKMPVPSMGWFAHATDPEGNKFAVWQSDESAPVPEGAGAQTASS